MIRRATPSENEILFDLWLQAVQATHAFVPPEDIQSMIPQVRAYFSSGNSELWVICDDDGTIAGFMGMSGSLMESLFIAPERLRRGYGKRLVEHAQTLHNELTVEVNEQNEHARRFYEACGFVVEGRLEHDRQGRSHPLLLMRCKAANA